MRKTWALAGAASLSRRPTSTMSLSPAAWPIEYFYERVWPRPFTERRTMQLGAERVARARLSADHRRLEDVDVLAEGVERRIVIGRDGTLYVTGADRFRFYDSDLDGVDHDFTDNPDIRRNFSGRVIRIGTMGAIAAGDILADLHYLECTLRELGRAPAVGAGTNAAAKVLAA